MNDGFLVKGATILSKYKFVEEQFGVDSYDQFKKKLQEKNVPMIFTAGWYPFFVFNQVLEQITTDFFNGDVSKLEQVGAYSARSSFRSVYRNFLKQNGFMSFLSRAPMLHKMFYSHGEMKVELGEDKKSCRFSITNQPIITKEDTYVTYGFYKQAAELHGVKYLKYDFRIQDGVVSHFLSW